MQLGLGAASLTKFCHKKLRMKTTAIELNPQVVAACRLWFKLPADDARLSVVLGDAAEVAAHEHWRGAVDALQVDLYDHEAAAPVLDSEAFYARLPQAADRGRLHDGEPVRPLVQLRPEPGEDRGGLRRRMRSGPSSRRARATPSCWRCARRSSPTARTLAERAETIETRWGLPARKWLRVFKPVA